MTIPTTSEAMRMPELYRTSESRTSCDGQRHWRLLLEPDEDDVVMDAGACDCPEVTR